MARRRSEPRVFFPWERRRRLFGAFGRARARQLLLLALLVVGILFVRAREERAAAIRATRVTITMAGRAIDAYRADHGGACPPTLADLVAEGYTRTVPLDAWGRPLRMTCPGRQDPLGYDLMSDGPDGLPGGLDRVQ